MPHALLGAADTKTSRCGQQRRVLVWTCDTMPALKHLNYSNMYWGVFLEPESNHGQEVAHKGMSRSLR